MIIITYHNHPFTLHAAVVVDNARAVSEPLTCLSMPFCVQYNQVFTLHHNTGTQVSNTTTN